MTALGGIFYRSFLYRRFLDGDAPASLRARFPNHAGGDAAAGSVLLDDGFLLGGRRIPFGHAPWSAPPSGPVLSRTLHGFGWLSDLSAIGTEAARARARSLTAGWIAHHQRWTSQAWSPEVTGRRLASWLANAEFLLAGASDADRGAFLAAAATQARHLVRVSRGGGGVDAFAPCLGRVAAAVCLGVGDLSAAAADTVTVIERQILPDGGHVSRNPQRTVETFADLLDIGAALVAAERAPPPALTGAIERMAPMIRALRHGDGGLALFHGGKELTRDRIDVLLAASGSKEPAIPSAPWSRYERLAAGRTVLIVDAGPPAGTDGGRGVLAFEMSVGRERIVVNCGGFAGDDPKWRAALRSAAAYSTLSVDDANPAVSGHNWWGGTVTVDAGAERREVDGAVWLDAHSDGYRRRSGLIHHRRIYLDPLGEDVRGEDALVGRGGRSFRIRFHLHPRIKAAIAGDGQSALLKTALGGWRFVAVGGTIGVEESVYLGASDIPQRADQIVVTGQLRRKGARVKWALRREGGES